MTSQELKKIIENYLDDAKAIVESNDNIHFSATVIWSGFSGLTRVQQQQKVYHILNDYIASGELHALTFKTYTPEKWLGLNKGA